MADGTEKPKDEVSTPEVEQETPKTFTQVDIDKIRNDASAEVGRATKAAKDAANMAQKANDRTNKYIEQSRVAELELHKDEPSTLSVIRATHAKEELEDKLAAKEAELSAVNQTMETLKAETAQSTKERNAREISDRYQVDVEDLLLTENKEAMEKLAHKLTKVEPKEVLRVDPGGGTGGNKSLETLLKVNVNKMSYQEVLEHQEALKSAM